MLSWVARGALLLAASALVFAQQLTHISGFIQDTSGASVPSAAVTLVNEDTGFRRGAQSNSEGGYLLAGLQPGIYKITVRKEGFRTVVRFGVKLDVAQPARVDFTLPVGAMQETITVEGEAPLLNSDNASVSALVTREWIDRLPLNGRGLLSLIELTPGSVVTPATRGESGQFTVNGQRPNSHYFTVDGVSVNSGVSGGGQPAQSTGGSLPGMTAFGSFHGLVSLEALDEFRVQTSSYIPEFGRLPGAQISLSSRSGSNEFHGSLFEYFRNEKLEANDWFANRAGQSRAPLRQNDFGVTLGGPVWKNHVFFFVTGENVALRQPFAWRTPVPDLDIRTQAPDWAKPFVNLFPAPNGARLTRDIGEWTGIGRRPAELKLGSGRIDAAVTSRLSAFARYSLAPSYAEFGSTQINHLDLRSWSVTGGFNLRLASALTNDFRIATSQAYARSYWRQANAAALPNCYFSATALTVFQNTIPCNGFFRVSLGGLGQVLSGPESDNRQTQWNIVDTTSLTIGNHQIRVGADYRHLLPERLSAQTYFSVLGDSLSDYLNRRFLFITQTPLPDAHADLHELSLFAQDTWRLHPRLTLTYGLRWELNPPPTALVSNNPFLPPTEQQAWEVRYNNIAPRVGLAARLDKSGRTLVRAGFGLFYDSSLALATDLLNQGISSLWQFASPTPDVSGSGRNVVNYSFAPDLRLPLVREWNVTLERAVTQRDIVSLGYVGAYGKNLIRREIAGREGPNPLVQYAVATNRGSSHYHSLQALYRRRLAQSFEANVSYSWSHSIDTTSADSAFHWIGAGYPANVDKGPSDFDVRHSVNIAATWNSDRFRHPLLRHWSLDGIFRARTGFPITVLNSEYAMGVTFANIFRPDLVAGQPVWIGKQLNPAAFRARGEFSQGNLGRNALTGFGMNQLDLALRRDFPFHERFKLQLRVEAFNLLNHPNLADPVRFLASPLFGQSVSMLNLMLGTGTPATGLAPMFQVGGPRALQTVLRLRF